MKVNQLDYFSCSCDLALTTWHFVLLAFPRVSPSLAYVHHRAPYTTWSRTPFTGRSPIADIPRPSTSNLPPFFRAVPARG